MWGFSPGGEGPLRPPGGPTLPPVAGDETQCSWMPSDVTTLWPTLSGHVAGHVFALGSA